MAQDNRVGEVLASKYRLEALLGSGGMGHVYRAVNEHIGRAVAIKVLRPEHARNEQVVDRFLREARAANLVRHPNVVDVLDIGKEDGGAPFIVQELLVGEDLAHLVERRGGRLPASEVCEILLPVIEAVAEAHARGVVHRDIKPENVFLAASSNGVVPKLLDFGISKFRTRDVRATEVGMVMGTPAYMAPEQVQGARDADPRSDVWAVGVMIFELIAGHLPFEGEDAPALFVAIATKDAPSLHDVGARVTLDISNVVARCLKRSPDARYASAADLRRDLALAYASEEEAGAKPPPSARSAPNRRSSANLQTQAARSAQPTMARPQTSSDNVDNVDVLPAAPSLLPPAPVRPPPSAARENDAGYAYAARAERNSRPTLPGRFDGAEANLAAPESPRERASRASHASLSDGHLLPGDDDLLSGVELAPLSSRESRFTATGSQRHRSTIASYQPAVSAAAAGTTSELAPLVGLTVVGLVAILGTGGLMHFVHRAEGWPFARLSFAPEPGSLIALCTHIILAALAVAFGVFLCRRGIHRWQGDVAGGRSSAVVDAALAAAVFFSAIEVASAVL